MTDGKRMSRRYVSSAATALGLAGSTAVKVEADYGSHAAQGYVVLRFFQVI